MRFELYKNLDVCISRQTISNWKIAYADKFDVVYDKLGEKL
ncbi:hypothetical protein [Intestinibacter bartlettii]